MTQWFILYRKEWLELVRSYRLIWVPLVFILLGAMQPVMLYMLPDLLASAGNLPAGTIIEMPVPKAYEVIAQTISQYGTLGLLILALAGMNAVSGERASGTAAMLLVKPVPGYSIITSKWAALLTLTAIAYGFGCTASLYYTTTLFGAVDFPAAIASILLFGCWLVVVGTLTLLFSTILRSGAGAAFTALAAAAMLVVSAQLLPDALAWSPGRLPGLASDVLAGLADHASIWPPVLTSLTVIAGLLALSSFSLRAFVLRSGD